MNKGRKKMKREPIYNTFETKEGFHAVVEQPWWVRDAFTKPGYCCEGWNCKRFIDLPCRMCKYSSDEYASPLQGSAFSYGFVNVILTLRHWGLSKVLVNHIVRNYVILSYVTVKFKCPYLLDHKTGFVFHSHCYDFDSDEEDEEDETWELQDIGCATLAFFKH